MKVAEQCGVMRSSSSKAGFWGVWGCPWSAWEDACSPFWTIVNWFCTSQATHCIRIRSFNSESVASAWVIRWRGSLDDMEEELKRTLADAARYINKTYDVKGLHSSFPERLGKLKKRMGDRLTEH